MSKPQSEYVPKSVLTDLDSILDTRLSLLLQLNPSAAEKAFEEGKYLSRLADEIGNIPYKVFRGYYDQRDKYQLTNALPTYVLQIIREHIGEVLTSVENVDCEEDLKVYVNVYPYELSHEELDNMKLKIMDILDGLEVEFLNKNIHTLEPIWVMENIGWVVMYDLNFWLEYHMSMGTLNPVMLMKTVCVGPTLGNYNYGRDKVDKSRFEDFKKLMSCITDYQLLSAKYFSAFALYSEDEEIKKESQKEKEEE